MINVFGDSHTRIFGNINGLNSYWLGPGRDVNLQYGEIELIKERIKKVNPKESDTNYLFFGEPNVRYQLNWDHHIFKKIPVNEVEPIVRKDYIDMVIKNYKELVDNLHFETKLITPCSPYQPSIPGLKYFNQRLKEEFGNSVVDIFKYTIDENDNPKMMFRRKNIHDPIHPNNKLRTIFEMEENIVLESEVKTGQNISEWGTISLR